MAQFGNCAQATIAAYVNHVSDGVDLLCVWEHLHGQLSLGDAAFAEVLEEKMRDKLAADAEILHVQLRTSAPPPAPFAAMPNHNIAIVQAFTTACYSMTEIAQALKSTTRL